MSALFPLLALVTTTSSAPTSNEWSPLFAAPSAPAIVAAPDLPLTSGSLLLPAAPLRPVAPVVSDDLPSMEYTYVEANYIVTDSHDLDETLKGVELTGSLELP